MRYIGNKAKLLDEIDKMLIKKGLKTEGLTFCDAFSGTATVGNYFNGFYKIIANDLLELSYQISSGMLLYKKTNFPGVGLNVFEYLNSYDAKDTPLVFVITIFRPMVDANILAIKMLRKLTLFEILSTNGLKKRR
jgi:adenine-specific DNA methylase